MSHGSTPASLFLVNLYSFLTLTLLLLQKPLSADAALMKCVECHQDKCDKPPDNCPQGLVWDSCDCCMICGRTEGEFCGGQFNHYGRCGHGLKCYTASVYSMFGMCEVDTSSPPSPQPPFQEMKALKSPSKRDQSKKENTAKIPANEMLPLPSKYKYEDTYKSPKTTEMAPPQMDDPSAIYMSKKQKHLDKCEPECTIEFCSENPRALCSAYRQADTKSCKDPCATTVCRACETRFDPSLSCVYCPYGQKSIEKKKYIDCIKEFGRCVKKGIHGKGQEFSNMKHTESSFYCAVPTC